jgi:hypothetical protein
MEAYHSIKHEATGIEEAQTRYKDVENAWPYMGHTAELGYSRIKPRRLGAR